MSYQRGQRSIDWLGAILLTGSVVLLLFAVSQGGELFGWVSLPVIAMLVGAAALFIAFVVNVRRVPAPLVDLDLVRSPLVRAGLGINILAGIVMFGETTYVPPMVQGVQAGPPQPGERTLFAGAGAIHLVIGGEVGQQLPDAIGRVAEVRKKLDALGSSAWLEVDGGISTETLPKMKEAGATAYVAATAIFKNPEGIAAGVKSLRELL